MSNSLLRVKVAAKQLQATDIYSYELVDPKGRDLPAFTAGAHIDIEVRSNLNRQYSLCNPPHERHRYVIAVLKDPATRGGSLAMHERLQVGDLVEISEPRNHFELVESARKTLLFAGGIGITPLICMAERLAQLKHDFELHYCTRSRDRMAFIERIQNAAFASRVHLHFDDGPAEQKLDLDQVLKQPEANVHLYVCGPGGFMEWVLSTAKQKQWPEAQVHREYFAAVAQVASVPGEFEVQLASSGKVFVVPPDKSIVAVLMEAGIDVPVSCEQGVCGTCITNVIEGEPEHLDSYFTDAERASNKQMTICCSRSKSRKLVLDL